MAANARHTTDGHTRNVAWFLENACPDHHVRGGPEHVRARDTAMRILARCPEIAHDSFYTAIVCGDLPAVERVLAERPGAATAKSSTASPDRTRAGHVGDLSKELDPKGWEPLLYLCLTRLPLPGGERQRRGDRARTSR